MFVAMQTNLFDKIENKVEDYQENKEIIIEDKDSSHIATTFDKIIDVWGNNVIENKSYKTKNVKLNDSVIKFECNNSLVYLSSNSSACRFFLPFIRGNGKEVGSHAPFITVSAFQGRRSDRNIVKLPVASAVPENPFVFPCNWFFRSYPGNKSDFSGRFKESSSSGSRNSSSKIGLSVLSLRSSSLFSS